MSRKNMKKDISINLFIAVLAVVYILILFKVRLLIFLFPAVVLFLSGIRLEYGFSLIVYMSGINFMSFQNPDLATQNASTGFFHPNNILTVSVLLFCIVAIIKQKKLIITPPAKALLFFVSYMFVSLLFTPAKLLGLKLIVKFIILVLVLSVFSMNIMRFKKIIRIVSVSGLFSIFIFNPIFYFVMGNRFIWDDFGRFRITSGGMLPPGAGTLFGMLFVVTLIAYDIFREKKFLLLNILYAAYAVATYTRKIWISMFAALSAYFILKKDWFKLTVFYVLVFFIFSNFIIYMFLLEGAYKDSGKSNSIERVSQGRSTLYSTFFERFSKKPVTGLGIEYTTMFSEKLTGIRTLHSETLRILYDEGILGFMVYLGFVFSLWKYINKSAFPYRLGIILFVFFFLNSVPGIVFDNVYSSGLIFFSIMGAVLGSLRKGVAS